jgi:hypothetical protein
MTTIYTHPDINYDISRTKILIRNCDWSYDIVQKVVDSLTDKKYDIYLYHDSVNDYQYYEGIRTLSKKVYDWQVNKHKDPIEWIKEIDNEF